MYELQVEGMTCGGCANSVKKSVQAVDSAAKVEVDLGSKKVRIDTTLGIDQVKAAVVQAGYPVTASTTA
ncbi:MULTISPECIES: heavy-metal-associated domain-containing protein [unclassified Massilia]|jgi:copper chaperone|uniref:heavy-metal-associated domain-containing protein n=1 Tax=unclassified Massilia TaxID=2609279 RepID=UPI00109E9A29|nr:MULTISPECIES: heavy-metal-associated domain-containing protein [unclassified Massilia]MBD8531643.1 heavy-metal-associated domain-containing protein [Massilia sp. CFBP 13647]MBD8675088.1 heavy-metal-associated domain-containing protein [Massilia sp. CFBP 13721]THC40198.1 copper chaperone [Massilia sp. Mn16-1_5]